MAFIPKYRRRALYRQLRVHLGEVFRELCRQKASQVVEGHLMADQVDRLVANPPKYAVAQVMGYVKGKSAIHSARTYEGRKRSFVGMHFWARGYWVSTVGRDEQAVRKYIQEQEQEDQRLDQLELVRASAALSGSPSVIPPALPEVTDTESGCRRADADCGPAQRVPTCARRVHVR